MQGRSGHQGKLRIAVIGEGAIAAGLLEQLASDNNVSVIGLLVRDSSSRTTRARMALPKGAHVALHISELPTQPDLLVECAGHGALHAHVLPALKDGISCVVVSIGALADPAVALALEQAARSGGSQLHLTSGAIGGLDALASAQSGGLLEVVYSGRKPPKAWQGTPADQLVDLDSLTKATLIFKGCAREAAILYPRNANVAAAISLAGLGLDATKVLLYADPGVEDNVHVISAKGTFGCMELTIQGRPLPSNPKTSALTVLSLARTIRNLVSPISI